MKKKDENATPSERARKALLAMVARLGATAYLIFIDLKMIRLTKAGESGMNMTVAIIITVFLAAATAVLLVLTLRDFFRGIKNEDYSMHKYAAEDLHAKGLKYNKHGEIVPLDDNSDELEELAELEKQKERESYSEGDIVFEDEADMDDDEYYYEEVDEEYEDEEDEE